MLVLIVGGSVLDKVTQCCPTLPHCSLYSLCRRVVVVVMVTEAFGNGGVSIEPPIYSH